MTRLLSAVGVVVAIVLSSGVAPAPAASGQHHPPPRPDLKVSGGSVSLTRSTVTASLSVKNTGPVTAKKSTSALFVTVAGKKRPLGEVAVKKVKSGKVRTVTASFSLPKKTPTGSLPLTACADSGKRVTEKSEKNNCRSLGRLVVPASYASIPGDPVPFTKGTPFTLTDPESDYWVDVPASYDSTHYTATELFVWLHGCGGSSSGDIYTVSPGDDQNWISVAVGGREAEGGSDGCWKPDVDQSKVLAAIADIETHFNIDPRRVVIGGYSSGGDLAYRTIFYHSKLFAGLLAENTAPFRDTGSTQAASLAAASWKFNVRHLAHTGDGTYGIDQVRTEIKAMTDAGFPVTLVEKPGGHADETTDPDLLSVLLPALHLGWRSPPA